MENWMRRTSALLGEAAVEKLGNSRVAVLGLGGVGGMAAECLCRSGVGNILLVDKDEVDETNRNRQIFATTETTGLAKTEAARRRLSAINPMGRYTLEQRFLLPENGAILFDWKPDFVIDAMDTVTAKLFLVRECRRRDVRLITCLGTGNRLDPTALRRGVLADTQKGCGCGLARVMRRELRGEGLLDAPVVYSLEQPRTVVVGSENGRHPPGSVAFVPPAAGCALAAYAVSVLLL